MIISLIVAKDKNSCIGKNGKIPWHIPADLKYFKKVTLGHHIIMGRKTFESIGKALPSRTNIVISRNTDYEAKSCIVVKSINAALAVAQQNEESEAFIIGGGTIYKETIAEAQKLYVTEVDISIENGDTFFPKIEENLWIEAHRYPYLPDYENQIAYTMFVYERRY